MGKIHPNIQALRAYMQDANVDACIIPSTDPHISEYTPSRWKTREWLSGFSGSAGTLVVLRDKAGLWTDSRYFLQAESQLKDTGIALFKMGLPETPEIYDWLASQLSAGDCVGIEGAVFAASEAKSLIAFFTGKGLIVSVNFNPCDAIWKDRPAIPASTAFILPEQFSGKSARAKTEEVLAAMRECETDMTVLASLDMIAWLFNIRGSDVEYNPVCVSYAIVSEKETVLFIPPAKLTQEVSDYLTEEGIVCADYDKITDYICRIPAGTRVLLTPSKINHLLYSLIPGDCPIKEIPVHPVDALKCVKNEIEIDGIRKAMQKDGVALVKFLISLEILLKNKIVVTELDVSEKLREFRSEQAFYFGESFETIAGYGPHGAIVHYGASEDSNAVIEPAGILLIDSGAQYFDGTTDITRTLALGEVTGEMKRDYTRVLKGHIQLASASFPAGTVGMQLDVLARQALWKAGQNFLHGTGHGVGHFLNVHEGPQSIRMNHNPYPLKPGMVTSNEPGLYRTGEYGIRIENLLLTVKDKTTGFGDFYAFETLTLCPIDTKLIDAGMLSPEEKKWLNVYHQTVLDQLSPFLSADENSWLREATKAL
jgi:Xaa-Pro aminopeptidase